MPSAVQMMPATSPAKSPSSARSPSAHEAETDFQQVLSDARSRPAQSRRDDDRKVEKKDSPRPRRSDARPAPEQDARPAKAADKPETPETQDVPTDAAEAAEQPSALPEEAPKQQPAAPAADVVLVTAIAAAEAPPATTPVTDEEGEAPQQPATPTPVVARAVPTEPESAEQPEELDPAAKQPEPFRQLLQQARQERPAPAPSPTQQPTAAPQTEATPAPTAPAAPVEAAPADAKPVAPQTNVPAQPAPQAAHADPAASLPTGTVAISADAQPRAPQPQPAQMHAPAPPPMPADLQFVQSNHPDIVTSIRSQLLPDGGTMRIRLDPPELGALQIRIEMRDGVMAASFQTSTDEATRLLGHTLDQLRTALESQGVSVERLQVHQAPREQHQAMRDDEGSRGQQQPDEQSRQEQQRRDMLRRMWRRLAGHRDELDVTA